MKNRWITAGIVFILFLLFPRSADAQMICYPSRSMSQWRCAGASAVCTEWYSEARFASQYCARYGSPPNVPNAQQRCEDECVTRYGGTCTPNTCLRYESGLECDLQASLLVPCTAEPSCETTTNQTVNCVSSFGVCTVIEGSPLGCWGPGPTDTPGPTSPPPTSTPTDTPTPTPGGPTPTDTPTPTPGGPTPTSTNTPTPTPTNAPLTTIRARAKQVSASDTTCTAVSASTQYVTPTDLSLSPVVAPGLLTQSGSAYVTWNNAGAGTYTLLPSAPVNYSLVRACWDRTATFPSSGEGMASSVMADGETLTWELGYILGNAWVQTGGGDVYGASTITSSIPVGTTPREFNINGSGNSPGIVTYGGTYDFDSDTGSLGETLVSSRDWLVDTLYPPVDLYQLFFRKWGSPPTDDNGLFADLSNVSKPASRNTAYYINGNMVTTGNWNVANGERIVFLINGNLTIRGTITITGTGFISFIVNGDIVVDPSVGSTFNSTIPDIEGIYMTSPGGTFRTGTSTTPGSERLVGQGMFFAGNFALERDLDSVGHNIDYSAELFTYNPALLVNMPTEMMDLFYRWQEVEP